MRPKFSLPQDLMQLGAAHPLQFRVPGHSGLLPQVDGRADRLRSITLGHSLTPWASDKRSSAPKPSPHPKPDAVCPNAVILLRPPARQSEDISGCRASPCYGSPPGPVQWLDHPDQQSSPSKIATHTVHLLLLGARLAEALQHALLVLAEDQQPMFPLKGHAPLKHCWSHLPSYLENTHLDARKQSEGRQVNVKSRLPGGVQGGCGREVESHRVHPVHLSQLVIHSLASQGCRWVKTCGAARRKIASPQRDCG